MARGLRYRHSRDGRWAKTLLEVDVCDWLGEERTLAMPYWDRYDEGVFVGGRYAGSPMHVDQVTAGCNRRTNAACDRRVTAA